VKSLSFSVAKNALGLSYYLLALTAEQLKVPAAPLLLYIVSSMFLSFKALLFLNSITMLYLVPLLMELTKLWLIAYLSSTLFFTCFLKILSFILNKKLKGVGFWVKS